MCIRDRPRSFEHVDGAECVYFEIENRNSGSAVMRRLTGTMHDQPRTGFLDQGNQGFTVSDIETVVFITLDLSLKPFENPRCIAFRTEEKRPVVVIDSDDMEPAASEEQRDFRPDQAARS